MRPLEEIRALYLNAKKTYLQTKQIIQRLSAYEKVNNNNEQCRIWCSYHYLYLYLRSRNWKLLIFQSHYLN
jgi:hypothetical protein